MTRAGTVAWVSACGRSKLPPRRWAELVVERHGGSAPRQMPRRVRRRTERPGAGPGSSGPLLSRPRSEPRHRRYALGREGRPAASRLGHRATRRRGASRVEVAVMRSAAAGTGRAAPGRRPGHRPDPSPRPVVSGARRSSAPRSRSSPSRRSVVGTATYGQAGARASAWARPIDDPPPGQIPVRRRLPRAAVDGGVHLDRDVRLRHRRRRRPALGPSATDIAPPVRPRGCSPPAPGGPRPSRSSTSASASQRRTTARSAVWARARVARPPAAAARPCPARPVRGRTRSITAPWNGLARRCAAAAVGSSTRPVADQACLHREDGVGVQGRRSPATKRWWSVARAPGRDEEVDVGRPVRVLAGWPASSRPTGPSVGIG